MEHNFGQSKVTVVDHYFGPSEITVGDHTFGPSKITVGDRNFGPSRITMVARNFGPFVLYLWYCPNEKHISVNLDQCPFRQSKITLVGSNLARPKVWLWNIIL